MKLRAALPLAALCSFLSCDPEIQPDQAFHITYQFPQALSRPVSIVSVGNLTIVATKPAASQAAGLLCINEYGAIQWSKSLQVPDENGLTISNVSKVVDNTFSVIGNLGSGYPFIIQFDIDGSVISSKKFSSSETLSIENSNTNAAGATVCIGSFHIDNELNGFALKLSRTGNIEWAVRSPGAFMTDGLTNPTETNTFLFPSYGSDGSQAVIKLDNDGELVKVTRLLNAGDLFLEKAVAVGDNFYLAYTEWNIANVYVVKVNKEGEFIKAIKFVDSENPEMDANNSSVFLSIAALGNLNVIELDADLNISTHKTVVNLVGGSSSTLHGHVDVSNLAISCVLEPFPIDPTYGDKGLNAIRFLLADWKTKCNITQSNLTSSSASFQTQASTTFVEAIDIQQENITLQVQDLVLNQTSICK